jgi:B9 domain-containing protein 1
MVLSLYGTNMWGTEVNLGYTRIHVPCEISNKSETTVLRAPIITPKSTNIWSSLINLITNRNPELRDPKILADETKTKNLFTSSYGEVVISLECITKGTEKLNFD